jgi:vacuolar protein-sorting-associated protein 4
LLTFLQAGVVDGQQQWTPCSPGDPEAKEMSWTDLDGSQLAEPPLRVKDFIRAIKASRPTVSKEDLNRSSEWTKEFGSEGA